MKVLENYITFMAYVAYLNNFLRYVCIDIMRTYHYRNTHVQAP